MIMVKSSKMLFFKWFSKIKSGTQVMKAPNMPSGAMLFRTWNFEFIENADFKLPKVATQNSKSFQIYHIVLRLGEH